MTFDFERDFEPQPATKAESTALLTEVVNVALYSYPDPWNIDSIYGKSDAQSVPSIEKGYHADAIHKSNTDIRAYCKYDYKAMRELLRGAPEKVHLAHLRIGRDGDTYDIFASTTDYHDDPETDVLAKLHDLLENNYSDQEIEQARQLDLSQLPEDFNIEVFVNLPTMGWFAKKMGESLLKFGDVLHDVLEDEDGKTTMRAEAEGMLVSAESLDTAKSLELDVGVTIIDSVTARTLIATLREDFVPESRL